MAGANEVFLLSRWGIWVACSSLSGREVLDVDKFGSPRAISPNDSDEMVEVSLNLRGRGVAHFCREVVHPRVLRVQMPAPRRVVVGLPRTLADATVWYKRGTGSPVDPRYRVYAERIRHPYAEPFAINVERCNEAHFKAAGRRCRFRCGRRRCHGRRSGGGWGREAWLQHRCGHG